MTTGRAYPRRYFELQARFAEVAARLLRIPLAESLLRYTTYYRLLWLDGAYNPANPDWQAFLDGCAIDGQPASTGAGTHEEGIQRITESVYGRYLARYDSIPQATPGPRWGCFAYERIEREVGDVSIHLHFGSHDAAERAMGIGPLSRERIPARMAELRTMFAHIRATESGITEMTPVLGNSWLYHRASYARLFPPVYGASSRPTEQGFQGRSLWGQLLRYDWQVNEQTAREFSRRLAIVSRHAGNTPAQVDDRDERKAGEGFDERAAVLLLAGCFPAQTLAKIAPIHVFYTFYGLG